MKPELNQAGLEASSAGLEEPEFGPRAKSDLVQIKACSAKIDD